MILRRIVEVHAPPQEIAPVLDWVRLVKLDCGHNLIVLILRGDCYPAPGDKAPCQVCQASAN